MCERVRGVHKPVVSISNSREISAWNEMCERVRGVHKPVVSISNSHEISAWNKMYERVRDVHKPILMRFQHETRCARDFMVSISPNLLHISFHPKISWDLTNRHYRLIEETKSFQNFLRIENRTIIKEVTGFQRLAIFRLLLATEMM